MKLTYMLLGWVVGMALALLASSWLIPGDSFVFGLALGAAFGFGGLLAGDWLYYERKGRP